MTPNIEPDLLNLPGEWDCADGMTQFEPTELQYQDAGEWLLKLHDAGIETSPDFEAWKALHPAHAFACAELEAVFVAAHRPAREVGRETNRRRSWRVPRKYLPRLAGAIAACAALLLAVPYFPTLAYIGADFQSGPGEVRAVRLIDGSRVTLNTKTALDADIGTGGRSARLRGGEAYFEVAKDPARPFTVQAGPALVKVLGTKFNIRMDDDQAAISVTEGRVWVMSRSHADQSAVLTAGQEALVNAASTQVQPVDPYTIKAWRDHQLFFIETPLRIVVKELNRYRAMPIVLSDQSLGSYKVTGVFSTRDLDGVMRNFEHILGINSVTVPPGLTILY
ncbi:MAG: FecR domain-containing protein [Novosphingobium sp.]|nr:FecR domain-containing protein [Novosphingobium sp.]